MLSQFTTAVYRIWTLHVIDKILFYLQFHLNFDFDQNCCKYGTDVGNALLSLAD